MNKILKGHLTFFGHIAAGIGILVSIRVLKLPAWLNGSVLVFLAFLLLNLAEVHLLKLKPELWKFWNFRRAYFLIFGFIAGVIMASAPVAIGLLTGRLHPHEMTFNTGISLMSIALTFVIVAWEELWFRGLYLNYCNKYLSPIYLSLLNGLLFMLLHSLNPEITLLMAGPALFFAGALLTILYFYYKTIWLPIGLHFANNLTGSVWQNENNTDMWFGSGGYAGAMLLALIFLFYLFRVIKHNRMLTVISYKNGSV